MDDCLFGLSSKTEVLVPSTTVQLVTTCVNVIQQKNTSLWMPISQKTVSTEISAKLLKNRKLEKWNRTNELRTSSAGCATWLCNYKNLTTTASVTTTIHHQCIGENVSILRQLLVCYTKPPSTTSAAVQCTQHNKIKLNGPQ